MKTIYEAKNFIRSIVGKSVIIKVMGLRNKNEIVEGIVGACYPNVFVVETVSGVKSFTYTDVLIGNILVKIK